MISFKKTRLLIRIFIFIIFFGALAEIIYFLILPPRVISVAPLNGQIVVDNTSLAIEFDKPVARQKIEHFIEPVSYGEWKFEEPLLRNHFFRKVVFTPAVNFKTDTEYKVKLKNITNVLNTGFTSEFSFSFKTKNVESVPKTLDDFGNEKEQFDKLTIINIPFDWQDYPLSCEAASLKMALSAKKVSVSEDDIMEKIGYDNTPHKGNIWGNPYIAFVGDINGKICSTGYGVYPEPVSKVANYYRPAEYFSGWKLEQLTKEIQSGNPIIVWGVIPTGKLTDCSWWTKDGQYIKAFKETHVRLAVGFIGSPENPSKIILKDPLKGDIYWLVSDFLTNWGKFGNSGVVIR